MMSNLYSIILELYNLGKIPLALRPLTVLQLFLKY